MVLADPTLRNAVHEAAAACQALSAGIILIGPNADKEELYRRAATIRVLHVAMHHFFDDRVPLLSFLKLAGNRGDDFLYAFEIADLALNADLVYLAACHSGRNRVSTGDEQIGIVRAFLLAGAKAVISALWAIEDESAAKFSATFYAQANLHDLPTALGHSQRLLIKDSLFGLPYFWAPYVITGGWQRIVL